MLCEFRFRLVEGGAELLLFEAVLSLARSRNLIQAGGRQRTDSTPMLAAVRGLTRLACVTETMRFVLEALACATPGWLRTNTQPGWLDRYERRSLSAEHLPRSEAKRAALARTIGEDGHHLLAAMSGPDAPDWLSRIPAVEILQRIWVQQFYCCGHAVCWRTSDEIPPASLFLNSPHDLEAHYARKGAGSWVGYKAHLTESCDDDHPRIVTHVQTSLAAVAYRS